MILFGAMVSLLFIILNGPLEANNLKLTKCNFYNLDSNWQKTVLINHTINEGESVEITCLPAYFENQIELYFDGPIPGVRVQFLITIKNSPDIEGDLFLIYIKNRSGEDEKVYKVTLSGGDLITVTDLQI